MNAPLDGDVVERVARALADESLSFKREHRIPSELQHWKLFEREAQAAVRAITATRSGDGELPEYGGWVPDVWDAYMKDLVGWEHVDNWARLPATFRWHEFYERLAIAIETRSAETCNRPSPKGESAAIAHNSAINKG